MDKTKQKFSLLSDWLLKLKDLGSWILSLSHINKNLLKGSNNQKFVLIFFITHTLRAVDEEEHAVSWMVKKG